MYGELEKRWQIFTGSKYGKSESPPADERAMKFKWLSLIYRAPETQWDKCADCTMLGKQYNENVWHKPDVVVENKRYISSSRRGSNIMPTDFEQLCYHSDLVPGP